MTTIQYEEIDNFFDQMKELNASGTVYLTTVRTKKENDMMGAIRVMFQDNSGVLHQYNHIEDIGELRLINTSVFDMFLSPEDSKKAKDNYMVQVKIFEEKLKKEEEKMKSVLMKLGVKKIYNAYGL